MLHPGCCCSPRSACDKVDGFCLVSSPFATCSTDYFARIHPSQKIYFCWRFNRIIDQQVPPEIFYWQHKQIIFVVTLTNKVTLLTILCNTMHKMCSHLAYAFEQISYPVLVCLSKKRLQHRVKNASEAVSVWRCPIK